MRPHMQSHLTVSLCSYQQLNKTLKNICFQEMVILGQRGKNKIV